ncbi:MAG: chorismate synthase [Clostridia bacterium]|nr:chorismate synthase [Clostridia bacterium]
MKNTFGCSIAVTIFGESHGEYIGAVIDGLAPGIKIDDAYIKAKLAERRPQGRISTARVEADEYRIISGVFEGYTTGTPITAIIPNTNKRSADYTNISIVARPGHADYTAECKYHGYQDFRGGGHFSGRITAAVVLAGAILSSALIKKGIRIGTHISYLKGVSDRAFENYEDDIASLASSHFPTLSVESGDDMRRVIEAAANDGDSVGGVLETAVIGLPAGIGEPWFDSFESMLSHGLFSVPGIKGVEFGAGFRMADMLGSEANDPIVAKDGKVYTETNNNGGINGGITNGMPVIVRTAVKPTPSIYKPQRSVDIRTLENKELRIEGRHDPAIIHRARSVVDAVCAIVIADMLSARYGTDYLASEK